MRQPAVHVEPNTTGTGVPLAVGPWPSRRTPKLAPNSRPNSRNRQRQAGALCLTLRVSALALARRALLRDHLSPHRSGCARRRPHSGAAGGAACGDLVRVARAGRGRRVAAAGFDAEGCGALTRCGQRGGRARRGRALPRRRPGRPGRPSSRRAGRARRPAKRHAAELAADALHRALGAAARDGAPALAPEPAAHARGHERRRGQRRRRPAALRRRRRGGGG